MSSLSHPAPECLVASADAAPPVTGSPLWRLRINTLLLLVTLFLSTSQNLSFWRQVNAHLPARHGMQNFALLATLFVALNGLLLLFLTLFSAQRLVKPALMLLVVAA